MDDIPDGGFRLVFSNPNKQIPCTHNDYACLDDALNAAGILYGHGYTLHQLLNCWGDKACPDEDLEHIAKLRHWQQGEERLEEHRRQTEEKMRVQGQDEMEGNPLYGMF